jgi:hypothetical protein
MSSEATDKKLSRRAMLGRLGLAAAAAYTAPALLNLSEAKASSFSGPRRHRRYGRPVRRYRRGSFSR